MRALTVRRDEYVQKHATYKTKNTKTPFCREREKPAVCCAHRHDHLTIKGGAVRCNTSFDCGVSIPIVLGIGLLSLRYLLYVYGPCCHLLQASPRRYSIHCSVSKEKNSINKPLCHSLSFSAFVSSPLYGPSCFPVILVQSVSALCLDYVPGVSSYVSLYKSVLPHVTCGLLLMSACKPVSMFVPVFLCLLRLSFLNTPFVTILVSSFLDPRVPP